MCVVPNHLVFESDGAVLTSESTLRFRDRPELTESLAAAAVDPVEALGTLVADQDPQKPVFEASVPEAAASVAHQCSPDAGTP